jgi:PAS domain S-box-containing protein
MDKELKLLHLEDNPHDAELIYNNIHSEWVYSKIKLVTNKTDFISALENGNYDIILCDFKLPTLKSGFETLDLVREKFFDIPVLFVTGTIGEELAVELLKKGATDYILKDNLIKLVPAIKRAIAEYNQHKENKSFQNALRESEERFRNLFMNSPVGIYRSTPDGQIIVANPALIKLLGFSSLEELKKRNLESEGFVDQNERDKFKEIIKNNDEVIGFETTWLKADGKPIYVLENSKVIRNNNGEVLYFEGTIDDITEKKIAQTELIEAKKRAEESDRLKTEFLAQMSHEIRTPLNTITNLSVLINEELMEVIDAETKLLIESIEETGKRLIRTMSLILNMANINTSTYSVNKKELELKYLIDKIIKNYEKEIRDKKLKLSFNYECKNEKINSDYYLIQQIIENLINNAIKYTDKGNVSINVYDDKNKKIIIEVADTGDGISEEYMPVLFKPFTQESTGYSRKYDGSGLGLALTKKYIELLEGEIHVKSKKGKGSVFTVLLKS